MQSHFAPAKKNGCQRDKITSQRRILRHLPHGEPGPTPFDIETIRIQRVCPDLPGCPNEQWIINIEWFGEKWNQRGDGDEGEQPIGCKIRPTLDFIAQAAFIQSTFQGSEMIF